MKRTIRCGKNGRERISVKVNDADRTVILTASSIYLPEVENRILTYLVNALLSRFSTVAEVKQGLESEGYTVLNPCDTQTFTF